ncbi:hypothetical protein BJ165DRAFT_1344738, partial [Panaeolus papilionaceus]
GGQGYTGPTTCVSGAVCTYSNPYYSQCVPGTGATTTRTTTPVPTSTTPPSSRGPNFWFSFGDSYTSTGFSATGTRPNNANPIGNPNFPGYPTTPGANWVGWLTSTYNSSQLFTYNYAVGGATIDQTIVPPYSSNIPSVVQQVTTFLNSVGSKPSTTPWTSSNALFSIWIGINDLAATYGRGGDRGAFSDQLLNSEFAQVKKLYDVGARNFLFVNVPPVDRSPQLLAQPTNNQAGLRTVIQGFNTRLAAKAAAFASANPGAKTWVYDSASQFTQILNNPRNYGFRDATTYGAGSDIFWG